MSARAESVVNAETPGAGRRMSWSWFGPRGIVVDNDPNPQANNVIGRPTALLVAGTWALQTIGAPPLPHGGAIYKGRAAWRMTSDAATGSGQQAGIDFSSQKPFAALFQEVRGSASFDGLDDFACWSLSAILAFEPVTGPVTGDLGFTVGAAGRSVPRNAVFMQSGIEFGPVDVGTIGVLVRQFDGGAVTFNQPTPSQPDMTVYNKYEIRFIGASSSREAQCKFLLNGNVQFVLSYGAGTLLPSQLGGAVQTMGFEPNVVNRIALNGTSQMYVSTNGVVVSCAPTEAALL